jgi:hypothetical protein
MEEAKAHQGLYSWWLRNPATEFTGQRIKTGQMIQHNFDEIITIHIPVIQIHSIKYSVLLQIKRWYTLY